MAFRLSKESDLWYCTSNWSSACLWTHQSSPVVTRSIKDAIDLLEMSGETWSRLASCSKVLGGGCSDWVKIMTRNGSERHFLPWCLWRLLSSSVFSSCKFFSSCCNTPEGDVCAFGKAQHEYTNLFESQGLTRLSLVWILWNSGEPPAFKGVGRQEG